MFSVCAVFVHTELRGLLIETNMPTALERLEKIDERTGKVLRELGESIEAMRRDYQSSYAAINQKLDSLCSLMNRSVEFDRAQASTYLAMNPAPSPPPVAVPARAFKPRRELDLAATLLEYHNGLDGQPSLKKMISSG